MKEKISIIIPVYNAEQYVERCIHEKFLTGKNFCVYYIFYLLDEMKQRIGR